VINRVAIGFAFGFVANLALHGNPKLEPKVVVPPPICDPVSNSTDAKPCRELTIDDDAPDDIDRTLPTKE
jgi:hypothetical protein